MTQIVLVPLRSDNENTTEPPAIDHKGARLVDEKFATFTLGIILVVFLLCKVIWYIEHGIFCRYSLQKELVVFEVKIKNFCPDYYPPRVAPAELCCLYITGLHPSGLGSLSPLLLCGGVFELVELLPEKMKASCGEEPPTGDGDSLPDKKVRDLPYTIYSIVPVSIKGT